jgi:serine phosphatase RsbU (regulator of sigma subunit)
VPTAGAAAPVERAVGDVIDAIPLPVPGEIKALILGLALVALLLAAHSLLASRRTRRLKRQRTALLEDVGLLQEALLPVVPERLGSLRASVAYRPASGPAAGGDFYDAFGLSGGRVGIIVGDVCGHGREALRRTTLVHYALRAYLEAGLEPRAALCTAGRAFDRGDSEITTVIVAIHDPDQGTLTYAAAGHPPPVLLGAPAHEPVTAASSPALGVGVPTGRRQTTVSLPAGTLACFFTDGLMEARVGDKRLGLDGLAAVVATLDPEDGAAALLDEVTARAGHVADDMAACIVRAEGAGGAPRVRLEQLQVDAAGAQRPALATFLAQCGLDEPDRDAALRRVRATTREFGGALICVHAGDRPARVDVAPPPRDPLVAPAVPAPPAPASAPSA